MRLSDVEKVLREGGRLVDYRLDDDAVGYRKLRLTWEWQEGKYRIISKNMHGFDEDDWEGLCEHLDEAVLAMLTGRWLYDKDGHDVETVSVFNKGG